MTTVFVAQVFFGKIFSIFYKKVLDRQTGVCYTLIEPKERGSTKLQKERKGAIPMYNEETHRLSPVLAA